MALASMDRPHLPSLLNVLRLARPFAACRYAGAAVEFALIGLAFFGYLMAIINLGMLGLTLSVMQRSLELTARTTAVSVAANGSTATCPTVATVQNYFNRFSAPIIPANAVTLTFYSYSTTGNVTQLGSTASPWVKSGSGLNGSYIAVNASYNWKPIGFSKFGGVTLTLTTVAFSTGAATCT
ncbi:TadE/TadG family type IV pilus assembly protein [Acidocella aromatica]|uniref:Pilus assembly protein n=1 Tax=Acidocella aromatica TaxID=1303579 RepID=A0A840VNE4_9PROT|nr:hypothetical protein [Acidocella aromatica]MBB5373689.1 hypothetical protein [Acidocella aromatica]